MPACSNCASNAGRHWNPNRWELVHLQVNTAPKLVLLDVGMVAELTPEDQQNLVGFFKVCMPTALVPGQNPWHQPICMPTVSHMRFLACLPLLACSATDTHLHATTHADVAPHTSTRAWRDLHYRIRVLAAIQHPACTAALGVKFIRAVTCVVGALSSGIQACHVRKCFDA